MNCRQVILLIKALPIGEWRPAQVADVERHLPECATCQLAFAAARAMESKLSDLPEFDAPVGFATTVASQVDHYRKTERASANRNASYNRNETSNLLAWVTTWLGGVSSLATAMYALFNGMWTPKFASLPISNGFEHLVALLQAGPIAYVLTASLIAYVAGVLTLKEIDR